MSSLNGNGTRSRPGKGAPYAHVVGWGMAVPEKVLTNHDLAESVGTSDEWIVARTGIRERRIAGPRETTACLATRAARQALTMANLKPCEVRLVIVATCNPNHLLPSTASLVQDALGAVNAGAFDLSAACSGFIYALSVGAQMIRSGALETVLVIGSETMSRLVDWNDRETCVLFGDGAGAFLLQAREQPGGVLSSVLHSDGSGGDLLMVPAGGSALPTSPATVRDRLHTITMNGREVFRFATRAMISATREVVEQAGLTPDNVSLIIPHQANARIIHAAARDLGLPEERFMINLDRYGNTSSASIPIAVCEAVSQGRINPGDNLVLVGFGAGLTWGAIMLSWTAVLPPQVSLCQRICRQGSTNDYALLRPLVTAASQVKAGTMIAAAEEEAVSQAAPIAATMAIAP